MQLGEAALVAQISDIEHNERTCPFCNAASLKDEITNDLTDSYDEDADPEQSPVQLEATERFGIIDAGVRFHNDSSKLGQALGGKPTGLIVAVPIRNADGGLSGRTTDLPVTCAAHHLIPGNAALQESTIMSLLRVDGPAQGNIGYDVNKAANGVWLPGNYALRGQWADDLRGGAKRLDYIRVCMLRFGQFHDSHTKYSDQVILALNGIKGKHAGLLSSHCPSCKNNDQARDPKVSLFLLVGRIDWLSGRLRNYVKHYSPAKRLRKQWKRNLLVSDSYGELALTGLESLSTNTR